MKIFLHTDNELPSKPWHDKFRELIRKAHLPLVACDVSQPGAVQFLRSHASGQDIFIGRIRHSPNLLRAVKPIYDEICDIFKGRCFPDRGSMYLYDDKRRQMQFLQEKQYPTPKTKYVLAVEEVNLDFPLVCKKTYGASSENVRLAYGPADVTPPCIVQEFCRNNDGDVRINTIGHRVMGYLRKNRPNDFRASGSGRLTYPPELPRECVELAHRISEENGFKSMAYDFLLDNDNRWCVSELSYTYIDKYILNAPYYYEMRTNKKTDKTDVWPEEFILNDELEKSRKMYC